MKLYGYNHFTINNFFTSKKYFIEILTLSDFFLAIFCYTKNINLQNMFHMNRRAQHLNFHQSYCEKCNTHLRELSKYCIYLYYKVFFHTLTLRARNLPPFECALYRQYLFHTSRWMFWVTSYGYEIIRESFNRLFKVESFISFFSSDTDING